MLIFGNTLFESLPTSSQPKRQKSGVRVQMSTLAGSLERLCAPIAGFLSMHQKPSLSGHGIHVMVQARPQAGKNEGRMSVRIHTWTLKLHIKKGSDPMGYFWGTNNVEGIVVVQVVYFATASYRFET